MSETVLDRLEMRIRSALDYDKNVRVAPVALLWPDEARQWEPVIDLLAERLPIVALGEYSPDGNEAPPRGPAYWVRCAVARTLEVGLHAEEVPVVYLPGVARSALRAIDECPAELAPIAELQYRSQWFSHPNTRDWSARGLLANHDRGLGLPIAEDSESERALLAALRPLLDRDMERLEKFALLDADFFRELVNPDPIRSLLAWLDDPTRTRDEFDDNRWIAFVQQSKTDFGFDPRVDGEITGARKLAARQGKWAAVWQAFADAPERYPGIPGQLRRARPEEQLELGPVDRSEVWPQDNEVGEAQLRNLLLDFASLTPEGARKEAERLDAEHSWRRRTVWAELDEAPLAFALEQLVALAEVTARPLAETTLDSLVADYVERGWRADDAALRALGLVESGPDRAAVAAAVSAIYRWWLDAGARALQTIVGPMADSDSYRLGAQASTAAGTVSVFVDGLRLDIAQRLVEQLADGGRDVELTTSLAALPTVTETAKAALVPVPAGSLAAGEDLGAARASSGAKASKAVLESLARESGVQWMSAIETGDPSGAGWTEAGQIDHLGHEAGAPLIDDVDDEVAKIARRVAQLLDAGWQQVEVITDHGWILLPGGMEKVDVPVATATKKKGRCARLKDGASVNVPTVPWYWDRDVRIAIAPGVTCFEASKEYEHGGVSPQECIVPRLLVRSGGALAADAAPTITTLKWLGLLCRIEFAGPQGQILADLRALPGDPGTSIAEEAKETLGAGKVSLVVPDEDLEGEKAYLVLVAPDGQILVQREVVVGRNR
ncbi:BREX-1 system phosphatase PglZ type B [Miltoncostaea oceani]|uniref:BREX-1 system phosphatase PglZ type B n=1 Tax=Miltoncostaea oceani TaxID=2843216 RepID=UPI001C3C7503|nr:BREX-1 system phosphatase PglZ type B [Miltoncostaea oceani]